MSKLSRRSFLKGTAVSALGAAALGMTACGNTAASSTASSAASVPASSTPVSSTPAEKPAVETGKPSFFTDPYQYKVTDAVQVVTSEVVVVVPAMQVVPLLVPVLKMAAKSLLLKHRTSSMVRVVVLAWPTPSTFSPW